MSYSDSALTTDPVLTGDLARVYGDYPATDGESENGSNLPGEDNNHPFYFNFYVDPFAIDPAE